VAWARNGSSRADQNLFAGAIVEGTEELERVAALLRI